MQKRGVKTCGMLAADIAGRRESCEAAPQLAQGGVVFPVGSVRAGRGVEENV